MNVAVTPEAFTVYNAALILDQMRHSKSFQQREREVDHTGAGGDLQCGGK